MYEYKENDKEAYVKISDRYRACCLPAHKVKGASYELTGLADEISDTLRLRQAVQAYESGLARNRAQEWAAAEAAFRECLASAPGDKPGQVMMERVAAFSQTPPEAGWDGVWVAGSK